MELSCTQALAALARERVFVREDGVLVYRELRDPSVVQIEALMDRCRALGQTMPRPRLRLVDLSEAQRPTVDQTRCIIRKLREQGPEMFCFTAFFVRGSVIAAAARFVVRMVRADYSIHADEREADDALRAARRRWRGAASTTPSKARPSGDLR